MAKSKRSHSQHHQPKNPRQQSKTLSTPSSSSSSPSDPKIVKKEARERKRVTQSSLPSNWHRYDDSAEDEGGEGFLDLESEGPSRPTAKSDVVKPKSKGADFGYLISEAKSELNSKSISPSFDDVLPDFCQGLGPLLGVRAEKIVSWTGTDNFLEDEETTYQEAPFLSLDLHILAEQLAKIDLAKRLFIESDLLPPDLESEKGNNQMSMQTPTQKNGSARKIPNELTAQDLDKIEGEIGDRNSEIFSSDLSQNINSVPASSGQWQSAEYVLHSNSDSSIDVDSEDQFDCNNAAVWANRLPGFEAAAAKTELDMLIDSIHSAVNVQEESKSYLKERSSIYVAPSQPSTSFSSALPSPNLNDAIDDLLNERSTSFLKGKSSVYEAPSQPSTSSSSALPISNLNDAIDDLLNETSTSFLKGKSSIYEALSQSSASSSSALPASNLNDAIDDLLNETSTSFLKGKSFVYEAPSQPSVSSGFSRSALPAAIDDRLNKTSNGMNQDGLLQCSEVKCSSLDNPPSSSLPSGAKSKVLEDFDSWLNSL
ncbi:hypothetical protein Nepgr_012922 [Nepenthes gracilis]|uniref:Uncharacterized protein n=1 Tax=Nepenthes gracilis TaxID=150966 RepID=A0AAD3SID8_NEPGR|nr:hypothetical protein Nepgr_012922 [Nepenthes gracilis]